MKRTRRVNRLKMYPKPFLRKTMSLPKKMKSCSKDSEKNKSIIVENFIEMLNTIKLYHWNTRSFAQHKATDELYQRLNEHVDKFVEVFLGKKNDRIQKIDSKINMVNTRYAKSFRSQIYYYREYLIDMDKCLDSKKDTDLINIRDEILADINQFLYLLTLS